MRGIGFSVADAVVAVIVRMFVASAVIAGIVVMGAIVSAAISAVVIGTREVEMVVVGIVDVYPEVPTVSTGIDGPVEVIGLYEAGILAAAQHPAKVVIAYIEVVVVAIERPLFASHHIVHQIAYAGNEVVVDFIYIVVLLSVEIQLIGHLIGEEKGFLTYFAITHSFRACAAYSSTQSGKQDKQYSFHGSVFFLSS